MTLTDTKSITLDMDAWRKLHRTIIGLPESCPLLTTLTADAMDEIAARRAEWDKYRSCSVCGAYGMRAHDGTDCGDVTVTIVAPGFMAHYVEELRTQIRMSANWASLWGGDSVVSILSDIFGQLQD